MKIKRIDIFLLIIIIVGSLVLIWLKFDASRRVANSDLELNKEQLSPSAANLLKDDVNDLSDVKEVKKETKDDLINITNIVAGQTINSPIVITGQARGSWFFEASFPVKLYDSNNNLLATALAQAKEDWMTDKFVPFTAQLEFKAGTSISGTLVFKKDNPSGLPENADELIIPVNFSPSVDKTKVKVYFMNNIQDPAVSCSKVFPVEREIIKTQTVARAALEELLKGVSSAENSKGFSTAINPNVKIQSLSIKDGVARVDFNEQLEAGVGGSCRVLAIGLQISETLKQFSSVSKVIISINGRTEDILQP